MDLEIGDITTRVGDTGALMIVRQICRARPDGFYHMQRYKQGRWDGYISLMTSFKTFPTGLVPMVADALVKKGYTLEFIDHTKTLGHSEITEDMLNGITLRDYQMEAIETLINKKRGVAKMATNSGKTEVMAGIIKSLRIPNTLIVVHTKELLYQTRERLKERLGIEVGIIGDGLKNILPVTVGMVQTLHNKASEIPELGVVQLLMVDECHHISSNQMLDVLQQVSGSYRFGFSGTPLVYDVLSDMKLLGATGDVVYEISNDFLIKHGYSATPTVIIHTIEDYSVDNWEMEYQPAYTTHIVNNEARNKVIVDISKEAKGIVLILVNRIEHGLALQKAIKGSVFVNGSDSTEFRKETIQAMRTSKFGIYIATPIYDEGVDIPAVDTVIMAAGGKSHVKLLQRIGRGMRRKEGANQLVIHDFLDDTNMYLLTHSEERIETYAKEGFVKYISNGKTITSNPV